MKYLLDTDTLSIFERAGSTEHAVLLNRLHECEEGDVGVSVVSCDEQAHGCHKVIINARKPSQLLGAYSLLHQVLEAFRCYPLVKFDADALIVFEQLKSLNLRIAAMDLRIAAIALAGGMTLVSRNLADFGRVPNLAVENWTR